MDLLRELHNELAKKLLEKIKSGECTSADFNAAAKFLKDNDITAIIDDNDELNSLRDELNKPKQLTVVEVEKASKVIHMFGDKI